MSKRYGEMLTDWVKAGGTGVVIHEKTHQWEQWILYFHQFEVKFVMLLLEGRKSWTVPAHDPMVFDGRFNPEIGRRKMGAAASRDFSMPRMRGNEL